MQKLLVVCPSYGKKNEALSSHTVMLLSNFKKKYQIAVMTSHNDEFSGISNQNNLIKMADCWGVLNLVCVWNKIITFSPDKIFIQYVPFLYGRGGINFSFPLWVLLIRLFSRAKIEIYFHELYYPFELKLKSLVMHFCHVLMLIILGFGTHIIFTTTRHNEKILRRFFPWKKKIFFLPVGPNISRLELKPGDIESFKQKHGISSMHIVLGSFGTFHPSKNYRLVFEIIKRLNQEEKIPVVFLMIGQDEVELKKYLGYEFYESVAPMIKATGKIDDYDINVAFEVMDIYLGYFVDGITTRRGSIIAAMQAGLPIISTVTKNSEKCFIKQDDIYLYDPDEEVFFKSVCQLIKHFGMNIKKRGKISHPVFKQFFDWDKIFEAYEKV